MRNEGFLKALRRASHTLAPPTAHRPSTQPLGPASKSPQTPPTFPQRLEEELGGQHRPSKRPPRPHPVPPHPRPRSPRVPPRRGGPCATPPVGGPRRAVRLGCGSLRAPITLCCCPRLLGGGMCKEPAASRVTACRCRRSGGLRQPGCAPPDRSALAARSRRLRRFRLLRL